MFPSFYPINNNLSASVSSLYSLFSTLAYNVIVFLYETCAHAYVSNCFNVGRRSFKWHHKRLYVHLTL